MVRPSEKPRVRMEVKEPALRESKKPDSRKAVVRATQPETQRGQEMETVEAGETERETESDWPCWSSQPVTLGDHVRSVYLDLCSGRTAGELQQTYPHHWGLLLNRLAHRPDLKLQLLDRVNRRD